MFAVGITHDAGKISNCKTKRGYVAAAFAAANAESKIGDWHKHPYNCLDVLASRAWKARRPFCSANESSATPA